MLLPARPESRQILRFGLEERYALMDGARICDRSICVGIAA